MESIIVFNGFNYGCGFSSGSGNHIQEMENTNGVGYGKCSFCNEFSEYGYGEFGSGEGDDNFFGTGPGFGSDYYFDCVGYGDMDGDGIIISKLG